MTVYHRNDKAKLSGEVFVGKFVKVCASMRLSDKTKMYMELSPTMIEIILVIN